MEYKDVFDSKYRIYSDGSVWSIRRNKFLKPRIGGRGYYYVNLGFNNSKILHRLIAEAFIPNPNNLPQVNHKDGDKFNNHKDNLEWCDNRINQLHKYKSKNPGSHFHNGKYVSTIQIDGKKIHLGYFNTPEEASKVYMEYIKEHNLDSLQMIDKFINRDIT